MASTDHVKVAIVGGGLCGISLAIALKKRSIPFTIYETRGSFTELGAGINLGPNTFHAFQLIDPSLGEALQNLYCRNPQGKEDVWMQARLGAPTQVHEDAMLITELMAPPTGNVTVQRNDLLHMLAERAGYEHASFDKKLLGYTQSEEEVVLEFADGTEDTAGVVIACDGIHSAVRRQMLGADNPATCPEYSGMGAYRALLLTEDLERAIGSEMARTSQVLLGPGAYMIMYPVDYGRKVNVGFWPWRREPWENTQNWVLPAQREAMKKQFASWGDVCYKIMDLMGDPPFFATHHHATGPESYISDRVCLIGDAAHAMTPHQGAGAGQAMEDAYVLSEVLQQIGERPTHGQVEAALKAYESVRKPRAERVLKTSWEAMSFWADFYTESLTDERIQQYIAEANQRFQWIWHADIAAQAKRAVDVMKTTFHA